MSRDDCDFSLGKSEGKPPEGSPAPSEIDPAALDGGVNRPRFWDDLYARGDDGWETGAPAPPLVALLARRGFPPGRAAVLGCGRGHDARLLAAHGHAVWGFDFSEAAIAEARRLSPPASAAVQGPAALPLTFELRDIFSLAEAYPAFFDLVWECTCFCAIDPVRRAGYVEVVRRALKPTGALAALFYPLRRGSGGPPFPMSRGEIRRLFAPHFTFLEAAAPAESIERRRGQEWLVLMRPKRAGAAQGFS